MTNDEIERLIQEKNLTAGPRLTVAALEALVAGEDYYVFPDTTVTVCALKLKTGFVAVGHAACLNPANFDPEIGRRVSRDHAFDQLWAFEGYLQKALLPDKAEEDPEEE